jgi:hypothetical protein
MVDVWFLALCLAVRKGLKPTDISKCQTRKIIDGSIFSSDPWRIHILMHIAIAHTGTIDIACEPGKMISLANGLATSGFPILFDMLSQDNSQDPIWNLSEEIESLLKH